MPPTAASPPVGDGRPVGDGATGALASFAMGIESPTHLLFLGAVALIVLGPKRLPELARALGKGMREFRQALGEGDERDPGA